MQQEYLQIGESCVPQGIRGEVKLRAMTEDHEPIRAAGKRLFEERRGLRKRKCSRAAVTMVLRFCSWKA